MDFFEENAILKLNLDALFLAKREVKSGRYENQRDINSQLQIIV